MRNPALPFAGALVLLSTAAPAMAQVRDENIGQGVQAPLRDLRIKDRNIPEVLLLAQSAPYSSDGTRSCTTLAAGVSALDAVLGPDADSEEVRKNGDAALAATGSRAVAGAIIPGFGLVRMITGADKAEQRVQSAIYAGAIRRAYLKGLGVAKGCKPPASATLAARQLTPALPPVEEDKEEKDKKKD